MLKPLDSAKKRGRDRKFRQSQEPGTTGRSQCAEAPKVRRDKARQAWRHKITSQIKGFGFFFLTMRSYPKALNQKVAR